MKHALISAGLILFGSLFSGAEVKVCQKTLGESLGGWRKQNNQTAEYALSGSVYQTFRPETTVTPEGGIFISIRIDHIRGWLSSDDHAMLEVTVDPQGMISSAKSNIAIQGRSIVSDVIVGTNEAGKALTGPNQAVQIGTDLVSDLTAKLLRENIVEAGRVSFPAAIRHNYNLLYQALLVDGVAVKPLQVKVPVVPDGTTPSESEVPPAARPVEGNVDLEVQQLPQPSLPQPVTE